MAKKESKFGEIFAAAILAASFLISTVGIVGFTIETNTKIKAKRIAEEAERAENERKLALIRDAEQKLAKLYENDLPSLTIADEEIAETISQVELVEDEEIKTELLTKISDIKNYRAFNNAFQTIYTDGNLTANYTEETFQALIQAYENLNPNWQSNYVDGINDLKSQKAIVDQTKQSLAKLFVDQNMQVARSNVSRDEYKAGIESVKKIKSPEIANQLNGHMNIVIRRIENRERAEAEARRRAEIEAAWVRIKTPYISQNRAAIYNGCEAAALLMGLQYRGVLRGKSLHDYVGEMPKSDNPHTGFVRDVFEYLPNDVPHWIAPDALTNFGKRYYAGVTNITGSGFDALKAEISRGNPVIVYVTAGNLKSPQWVGEEAPANLHVVLLVGYNPKSGQVLVNDPWTRTNDGSIIYSESAFVSIFNQIGRKAVAIR